ncbi:MAG: hypothetical protein AAF916_04445 [Planctomycetota bacterium]
MKMTLRWSEPTGPGMARRRAARRVLTWMSIRLTSVTLVAGYGFWWLATYLTPIPLPDPWYTHTPWIVSGFAAAWLLMPLQQLGMSVPYHTLNRWGLGENKPWRNFAAFDVQPHPEFPDHGALRLFHHCAKCNHILLPEETRRSELVVRAVARKLTHIDQLGPARREQLLAGLPTLPCFFYCAIIWASIGWGCVTATAWVFLHPDPVNSELLPWVWLVSGFLNPALTALWILSRRYEPAQRDAIFGGLYGAAILVAMFLSIGVTTMFVLIRSYQQAMPA